MKISRPQSKQLAEATISDPITWIKEGIKLYVDNPGVLILSTAIAAVLGIFSLGILIGPLFAGLFALTLRIIDGDKDVAVGDVFSKMDQFVDTVLYSIITIVGVYLGSSIIEALPLIGGFLSFCFQVAAQAALAFGLLLIVDRKLGLKAALTGSWDIFMQNPPALIVLSLCTGLIVAAGALVFGVGIFLTLPIHATTLSLLYRNVICHDESQQQGQAEYVESKIVNR